VVEVAAEEVVKQGRGIEGKVKMGGRDVAVVDE
jgi:hypothetical protein